MVKKSLLVQRHTKFLIHHLNVDTKEYIFDNFMQFDSLDVVAGNDDGQRKLRMVLRLIDRKKSDTNVPVVMQTIKVG
jgi:hypothetical protein